MILIPAGSGIEKAAKAEAETKQKTKTQ